MWIEIQTMLVNLDYIEAITIKKDTITFYSSNSSYTHKHNSKPIKIVIKEESFKEYYRIKELLINNK